MLVPAGVLVLIILGAIAVDFSIAFLGQRELTSAAAAAANDAASQVSDASFYHRGELEIDKARVAQAIDASIARREAAGVQITARDVTVSGNQICVSLRGEVPYLFARALPFIQARATVTGQAAVTAAQGAPGAPVPPNTACPQ
jgi:Flp pilus assembly protein TadG